MWSCSTAAIAWASRRKRLPALALAARVGSIALRATLPLELRVLGLVDDAHAAVAQDLEDAILAQPAQLVGGLRRRQEIGQAGVGSAVGLLGVDRGVEHVRAGTSRPFVGSDRRLLRADRGRIGRQGAIVGPVVATGDRRRDSDDLAAAGALDLLAGQRFLDRELLLTRSAGHADHGGSLGIRACGRRAQRLELFYQVGNHRTGDEAIAVGLGAQPASQGVRGGDQRFQLLQARATTQDVFLVGLGLLLRQTAQEEPLQLRDRGTARNAHGSNLQGLWLGLDSTDEKGKLPIDQYARGLENLSRKKSGSFHQAAQFFAQAAQHAEPGNVNRVLGDAQLAGHVGDGAALDHRFPAGLPGGRREFGLH